MAAGSFSLSYNNGSRTLWMELTGDWRIDFSSPSFQEVLPHLDSLPQVSTICLDSQKLTSWDSSLVSFLFRLKEECKKRKIVLVIDALPQGVKELLSLVQAAQSQKNEKILSSPKSSYLDKIADEFIKIFEGVKKLIDFLGELMLALLSLLQAKAYIRKEDFLRIVQNCGAEAFGLVSLISLLVGIILAFVGALQLMLFGAQIFIADIVGIAMVRVMGAVMTGIIMSGRTAAAFAAELGLMQVNEEIDAFKTMGISPMQFLVLPRFLALVLMMPLLTLYANFMGILGGLIVGSIMFGLNPVEYITRTQEAVGINNLWVGLVHSLVFGVIISIAGCFQGLRASPSALAVGTATTRAVVSAITSIIIATAIITYLCHLLGV